jgi:hypothetical protein
MHHHNQTIADLEKLNNPSTLEIVVCFVLFVASIGVISVFLFSF